MEIISSMELRRMEITVIIITVMAITANGIMDGNGRSNDPIDIVCLFFNFISIK